MKSNRFPYGESALICLLATAWCQADIAPTKYVGSGIAPAADTTIRMASAKVEIVWGTPCKLSAEFQMVNESTTPKEMMLGFPLPLFNPGTLADGASALSIEVNRSKLAMKGPDTDPSDREFMRRWNWHHGKCTFPPGQSGVLVTSDLRASRVYGCPYRETIRYCIETGSKWAGTIGSEEVIVRFPDEINTEQILEIKPGGFRIDGRSLCWKFHEIEPEGSEFDIELTYLRPDAMDTIRRLRRNREADPTSNTHAVELAEHLFALGYSKSNSGFPPGHLTEHQFRRVSKMIADPENRKVFIGRYQRGSDGSFEEIHSDWNEERYSVVQMLAEAGYRDEESTIPFIKEAEALVAEALKRDAHSSEAWKSYLANYWRTSFAAGGHWFGTTHFGKRQIAAIERAARNCPDDEVIELWRAYANKEIDRKDFETRINKHGDIKLQFPEVDYEYY